MVVETVKEGNSTKEDNNLDSDLTNDIFDCIAKTKVGVGGEIQLTDAIDTMNKTQPVFAHVFNGERHDVGNKEAYLETSIEYGLSHPQIKDDLRKYIIAMGQKLQNEDKKTNKKK